MWIQIGFAIVVMMGCSFRLGAEGGKISREDLCQEIAAFTREEIGVHFKEIQRFDTLPSTIFGASTEGQYSWGSFMRTIAAVAAGEDLFLGKDSARIIGELGVRESRKGEKAFSQLFALLALRHYGVDLRHNRVWQQLSPSEKQEWRDLLNLARFFDETKGEVIALTENYLGVAARIAAMSWEMGLWKERRSLDALLERAAKQFIEGALYADDAPPTGRYDRYSNEFVRFCWDAAEIAQRSDLLEALRPSLRQQMKLWWDLVSTKGTSYPWGRTQGLMSYLDGIEIAAFLSTYPEFRPASLEEIASVFCSAWNALKKDYDRKRHLFPLFRKGRGCYHYISKDREWQQTMQALGKLVVANQALNKALRDENISRVPLKPHLKDIARFEYFSRGKEVEFGVWIIRQGDFAFSVPFTTGPKPGMSDYLPAPMGLPDIQIPVERIFPVLVPFITLEDGKQYVASEGANRIEVCSDGKSLQALWNKWGVIGDKSGERYKNGLKTTVEFRFQAGQLIRCETLCAERDVRIVEWKMAVPENGQDSSYLVEVSSDWKMEPYRFDPGKTRLRKGVFHSIANYKIYEAHNLDLKAGESLQWKMVIQSKNAIAPTPLQRAASF